MGPAAPIGLPRDFALTLLRPRGYKVRWRFCHGVCMTRWTALLGFGCVLAACDSSSEGGGKELPDIEVSTLLWSEAEHDFVAGPVKCFGR